jgi:uncharacterized protein YjiS (DUF1127 family)
MTIERISIEVTNQCAKACWFCYNHSQPAGETRWTTDEIVSFVTDCASNGLKAVSLGGGEPLQYDGLFTVLERLRGILFRSITTNGLLLDDVTRDRLVASAPDKVHISIHFPEREAEVRRVIQQVHELSDLGIPSGINLLVARSALDAARRAAARVRESAIGNDRIVYLPMRGMDTPTPDEIGSVAGAPKFQSMSCLMSCARSPRFCSIAWNRTVAWCSYTETRRALPELSHRGLMTALNGLGLAFCGGTDAA